MGTTGPRSRRRPEAGQDGRAAGRGSAAHTHAVFLLLARALQLADATTPAGRVSPAQWGGCAAPSSPSGGRNSAAAAAQPRLRLPAPGGSPPPLPARRRHGSSPNAVPLSCSPRAPSPLLLSPPTDSHPRAPPPIAQLTLRFPPSPPLPSHVAARGARRGGGADKSRAALRQHRDFVGPASRWAVLR